MPFSRLLLLYDRIDVLATEEEIRDLVTIHAGDPHSRLIDLQERLHGLAPRELGPGSNKPIESRAGFVETEDVAGSILELRARQIASAERRAAERAAEQAGAQSPVRDPVSPDSEGSGPPL